MALLAEGIATSWKMEYLGKYVLDRLSRDMVYKQVSVLPTGGDTTDCG